MNRPTCVHCGKPYGKRRTKSHYLVWPSTEAMPAYQGGDKVVLEKSYQTVPHGGRGTFMGQPYTENDNVAIRETWNGEWVTSYDPFCTLRCAYDYARRAYVQRKAESEQREHDAKARWRDR